MKRSTIAVLLLALLALAVVTLVTGALVGVGLAARWPPLSAADSPWAMFQHDPQHTGRSPFVGPQQYSVEWELPLPGFPGSPAIGADGTIYITTGGVFEEGAGCFLYAVNPDGSVEWRFELPGPPASTAPAIGPDGTIYVHSQGVDMEGKGCGKYMIASVHYIQGINPGGSLRCQFPLNGGHPMFASSVMSAPTVGPDGTIYVGDTDTALYALNPDCTLKWAASPSLSSIDSSPAMASDGTVYIVDGCAHLYAYAPDGNLKWGVPLFNAEENDVLCGASEQSPAVGEDGTIYVQSLEKDLYAITPSGTLRCKFLTSYSSRSTPSIAADGTIYLSARLSIDEAGLYAINPDCSLKWKFLPPYGSNTDASLTIGADGTIYWRSNWGTILAVNPDGSEKWSGPLWVDPLNHLVPSGAIGENGILYVGTGQPFPSSVNEDADRLVAIGSPLPSATPMPTPTATPTPPAGPTRTLVWDPGWHNGAWSGPDGTPPQDAFACAAGSYAAAYRYVDGGLERFFPNRPDISDMGPLNNYDAFLILVTAPVNCAMSIAP